MFEAVLISSVLLILAFHMNSLLRNNLGPGGQAEKLALKLTKYPAALNMKKPPCDTLRGLARESFEVNPPALARQGL